MALKFTVHGVQSFIKGHRKSGVISIKHSRELAHVEWNNVRFLCVTATYIIIKAAAGGKNNRHVSYIMDWELRVNSTLPLRHGTLHYYPSVALVIDMLLQATPMLPELLWPLHMTTWS